MKTEIVNGIKCITLSRKVRGPFYRVVSAVYVGGHRLLITFNDGFSRVVDFGPYVFRDGHHYLKNYRMIRNFKRFHIEDGDLMWGDFDMIFHIEDLRSGKIKYSPLYKSERRKIKNFLAKQE